MSLDHNLENAESDSRGWIGVDLDGTLAVYHKWEGIYQIGEPVPEMVARVKEWRSAGKEVRIFTARVGPGQSSTAIFVARMAIRLWCRKNLGEMLTVTASKDFNMTELWDDRAVRVIRNTGEKA